jgi:hypothetical protein
MHGFLFFILFLESAFITRNMYVSTKTRAGPQCALDGWNNIAICVYVW